ncbi:Golgi-associated RAB2 interactor protein 4-like [Mesoplodon densirostris]|uniref:Golgi-associated RAB2 interactor protein 4-like n=1 Tax=Mesoplodon densirostris TaxID=48708 RepID=UPI0028DC4369|nr:Golgi-associated RAB2 interactor protein 4-like [Mesoplodon densirostris]XP_059944696.1 Golgi-associated RAB2 interactor protein 4-like [Mesoplodon densirostris]XP_059944697.1 Golgi-associated RAB2 interactor protein 4-like [Mesoplodon densirostris]XP_059944702.1 Golgi-associated RAB2 interactor protein 4-like [Mesoplodon densirostris]
MSGDSLLPYHTARSSTWVDLFHTTAGKLQRQLHKGEYDIFKYAAIFESDFIQVTKRGDAIDVHNWGGMVTMGITSSSPVLPLPDIMLLARRATGSKKHAERSQATKGKSHKAAKTLELTRLLPLDFVRISTHNREKQQLRVKLATGRCFYLQLCPPLDAREDLFAEWEQLIDLLRPPVDSESHTYAVPVWDMTCMPVFEEEQDGRRPAVEDFQGKGDRDQVSASSFHTCPEVAGATPAASAGGHGIHLDSHKSDTMPDVAPAKAKPTTRLDKASASQSTTKVETAGVAGGTAAGALSPAVIKSPAAQEQSTARAATASDGPGGSKTTLATGDTARTSLRSGKTALAGAENNSQYASSMSTSLSAGAGMTVVGAEPTSKTVKGRADREDEGTLVSSLPQEGKASEQDGSSQRVSQARKGRRERREHWGEDRALTSPSLCSPVESHQEAAGSKTIPKAAGPCSGGRRATRDDQKAKGHGSPGGSEQGTAPKGISRAPITSESKTSHKSGRSVSPARSGPTTKRLNRISSFFRNMRARLTKKTVASSRNKHGSTLAKPVQGTRMEAIPETAESGQGLEIAGVTSETMEPVTVEAHQ